MQGGFPLWIEASAALTILALFSYIQFRYVPLAVLTTLAPLPAAVLAAVLHISSEPASYLFGFFSSALLASGIEARVCDGETAKLATRKALRSIGSLLIWPLVVGIVLYGCVETIAGKPIILATASVIVASVVSAIAFVFSAGRILPYDEDAITRANRARESRERGLDSLSFIAQPRWGWSISGIALIFSVLGYFRGGDDASAWTTSAFLTFGIAEALLTSASFVATRSLRSAIAFALAGAVLICLAAWITPLPASAPILALAMAPTLVTGAQSACFAREGDKITVAILRSLERHAVTIIFFSVGSAVVLCLFGQFNAAVLVAGGVPVALLLFPALMTVVYVVLPTRASLDAYRLR